MTTEEKIKKVLSSRNGWTSAMTVSRLCRVAYGDTVEALHDLVAAGEVKRGRGRRQAGRYRVVMS